jgi:outer membrane lipoprotein carrier protein
MGKLRTSSILLGVTFALSAAEVDTDRTLKGIEDRYNHIQTLQVNFVQTYKFRGPTRAPEKGTLYLHKPGRMRWQYTVPEGKLGISDGKYFYDYDPGENRANKQSMKVDDDLRGPLAFLLGNLDFHKDFGTFEASLQGADVAIKALPKSDKLAFTEVSFLAAPDFTIKELTVKGQAGDITRYVFSDEKKNPSVPETLFRPPPGIQFTEPPKEK